MYNGTNVHFHITFSERIIFFCLYDIKWRKVLTSPICMQLHQYHNSSNQNSVMLTLLIGGINWYCGSTSLKELFHKELNQFFVTN